MQISIACCDLSKIQPRFPAGLLNTTKIVMSAPLPRVFETGDMGKAMAVAPPPGSPGVIGGDFKGDDLTRASKDIVSFRHLLFILLLKYPQYIPLSYCSRSCDQVHSASQIFVAELWQSPHDRLNCPSQQALRWLPFDLIVCLQPSRTAWPLLQRNRCLISSSCRVTSWTRKSCCQSKSGRLPTRLCR